MSLAQIRKFHGHTGIWACIGFRAGKHAKRVLKPECIKDLTADVYLNYQIPYSCALDGVQLSSCCTTGKKNLNVHDSDVEMSFVFLNKKTDKFIKLKPSKEVLTEIEIRQKMGSKETEEEDSAWILKLAVTKLFDVVKK
jgi:formylmethanofuran dehydrogenase subunit E|tara:strand:+ start:251 stop:667 length:417 start_codon:yes stop_codon:yes gene_type:complete